MKYRNLSAAGDWTLQAPSYNAAFSVNRGHPVRTDGKSLRDQLSMYFRLQPGWTFYDPSNGTYTYRCEVFSIPSLPRVGQPALPTYIVEGEEWFFAWSKYIPAAFPAATASLWHVLAQWQGRQGGSPPLTLVNEGSGDELKLKNNHSRKEPYWRAPMANFRGKWTDFVARVKFHRDPAQAGVGLWVNGAQVADSNGQDYTMRPDQDGRSYPKYGLYRENRPETSELWVNGPRMADSYELVVAK